METAGRDSVFSLAGKIVPYQVMQGSTLCLLQPFRFEETKSGLIEEAGQKTT